MNNKILDTSSFYGGLNMNPIPLEASQDLTTTKWLLGMDKKLSTIIQTVNNWYDTLIQDMEGNGILFDKLKDGILVDINNSINGINESVTSIQADIDNIKNSDSGFTQSLATHTTTLADHTQKLLDLLNVNNSQDSSITNINDSITTINTSLADKETRLADAIINVNDLQSLYSTIDISVQSLLNQIGTKADASATNYAISQMVTKVNGKGLSTNDYTNVEKSQVSTILNKADISYVNEKIASIVSGAPSGVYATLSALQTAYPTGNGNKIYIVTADGKWYYWSGSAWTAGGQYQSTGLTSGSIGLDLLSFNPLLGKSTKNLFNKLTVTTGFYVAYVNGTLNASPTFSASAFIPVKPNTQYVMSHSQQYAFYDVNKNNIPIGTDNTNTPIFTTPSNCYYVRVTVANANLGTFQLELGNSPTSYISFGPNFDSSCIDTFIPADKLDPLLIKGQLSKNLFDKSKVTHGYYVNFATGQLVVSPPTPFSVSDYIPVKPSTIYTKNYIEQFAFYDINKVVIPQSDNTSIQTFTTPSNCAYVRLSVQDKNLDFLQLEEGNVVTSYERYGTILGSTITGSHYQDVIIVAKSGGDYATLEEAIAKANDTPTHRVTIKIMPGTYKGTFDIRGRNLSLIGEDKYTCIIRNDSGNYYTPPINMSGGGIYLANLTIISTIDDGTPYTVPSYAIHCDAEGEGVSEIYNCIIRSKVHACIGIGLWNNQKLIVNSCDLYKNDIATPIDMGTIYAHNHQPNGAVLQKFVLKNSTLRCDTGRAMVMQDANHREGGGYGDSKDTVFSFYNNMMWSDVYKKNNYNYGDSPLATGCLAGYIKLDESSYGNNLPFFNA